MRAHMLKYHGIEINPSGGSRHPTPVSMVPTHRDSPSVVFPGEGPSSMSTPLSGRGSPSAALGAPPRPVSPINIQPIAHEDEEEMKVNFYIILHAASWYFRYFLGKFRLI